MLLCDSRGRTLDGDIMLWVIGRWFAKRGVLGAGVTATVMSNMVLEDLLAEDGIKVFRCPVGDRYVLDTMRREGARIGGEQSGHIIALEYANTGDGLCAGILFLKAVAELGEDISTLADRFERYPQVLRNMRVDDKDRIMTSPLVGAAAEEAERLLKGRGRMLLRPSGTEPLIRIFAESRDAGLMNQAADIMEAAIKKAVENHG
ncbi:Phosphoglucosamine mutase [bioreactor metagenome]|uniref:Phosphoglucosamine mutase n=1 Tax=bioreactor metagenome TaxID=1076179 RepID=A0A645H141_9ZZZZ